MNYTKLFVYQLSSLQAIKKIFFAFFLVGLVAVSLGSCQNISIDEFVNRPTETLPFISQPEPHEPLMNVNLSGLADDTLAKLQVYTEHGARTHWGTHPGNGSWEIVLYEKPGVNYIVTVAADGYTTSPISYTVQISGTKVFVVKNGQITSEEATHLDFHFIPIVTQEAPTAQPETQTP